MCHEQDQRKKTHVLPQAVSSLGSTGVYRDRHPRTSPENRAWKQIPVGHDRQVLKANADCTPSDDNSTCVRSGVCDHWVYTYGAPQHVLTDNGPQFTAKFFHAVCRELGIEKVFTTAYHPQTNGQVERFNRTILNSLRGYVAANQNNWDEFTSALTFAYNARVHTAIGLAPFELVLSRPPVTLSTEIPSTETECNAETEKLRFLRRLKELLPMAAERLRMAQKRYKRNYDKHVRPKNQEVREGGWVYVRKEVYDVGVNPKLLDQVEGPFQVFDNDHHTMLLRMGDHLVRVNSDRITPAPAPRDQTKAITSSPVVSKPGTVDSDEPDPVG
jgi:hypothetical protein